VFKRGVGVSVLSQYLQEANREVEVWLQVKRGGSGVWLGVKGGCLGLGAGRMQVAPTPSIDQG